MSNIGKRWDDFYLLDSPYKAEIDVAKAKMDLAYSGHSFSMFDKIDMMRTYHETIEVEQRYFQYMARAQMQGIDPIVAKLSYDGGQP